MQRFIPKQKLVHLVALALQTQTPILLAGKPGSGKTTTFRVIAKVLGWHVHILPVPGKRDPAQVIGLPKEVPYTIGGTEKRVIEWIPYRWILDLLEAPRSILMLDDIAEASRDMQSFFLELVYDRILGDVFLKNTSMGAAANPIGGDLEMTEALSNRVLHLPWAISPEEHGIALQNGFPDPEVTKLPEDDWEKYIPVYQALVGAFLRTIPDFNKPNMDRAEVEERGAFGSQRTWDYAIRMLAAIDAVGLGQDKDIRSLAVNGAVGNASGDAFFVYTVYGKELPTVEQALGDPRCIKKAKVFDRPDKTWMVIAAVTRHALWKGDTESWSAAWNVLAHFAENGKADFAASAAKALDRYRPNGVKDDHPSMAHYRHVLGK